MLRFDDRVWLLWAVWILLLPLKWLVCGVIAACIHELCHMIAVVLLGGKIHGMTIAPFGAQIEVSRIGEWQEAVCAIAGPIGSFGLALFIRCFPLLGLCALVQGIVNLLPVYPLDGGRALRGVLGFLLPNRADVFCKWIERTAVFVLVCALLPLSLRYSLGIFPVFFCIFVLMKVLPRKRP